MCNVHLSCLVLTDVTNMIKIQDLEKNRPSLLLDGFKKTVKTVSDTMVLRLVTW